MPDERAESVCVYDWNGHYMPGGFPGSHWADYWYAKGVTTFGGDWVDVPNMYTDAPPSTEQVEAWAEKHIALEDSMAKRVTILDLDKWDEHTVSSPDEARSEAEYIAAEKTFRTGQISVVGRVTARPATPVEKVNKRGARRRSSRKRS